MAINTHSLLEFFAAHLSVSQIVLFAIIMTILWFTERYAFQEMAREKWGHTLSNAFLILTALPLQLAFNTFLSFMTNTSEKNGWGIAYHLQHPSNIIVRYLLMFFVLDFLDYVYHWAMHRIPALWRFHLVHHTDTEVDVSTTLREHPGETLLRNCFLIIGVLICGIPFAALILRQIVQTFTNIFSHTTFRLPSKVAQIIGWVFITPNLHHIHHHMSLPYTDRNYGDTFSIWDRLFGTFADVTPNKVRFGLDTHLKNRMKGYDLIFMPYLNGKSAPDTSLAAPVLKSIAILIFGVFCLCAPMKVSAEYVYPDYIRLECPAPLTKVGYGIYRRFGFRVYQATLWTAGSTWDPQKPYLLELKYTRDVSKDTLIESVLDDIRDQGVADDTTLDHWKNTLSAILPAVNEGDVLAGLSMPGRKTELYLNGSQIAFLDDDKLSSAFFDMWFGIHADPELREGLLNQQYKAER